MFEVINGKNSGFLGNSKIYIGRANKSYLLKGSVLQNRFVIGQDGNREEVVAKYRQWLWQEVQKRGEVFDELVRIAERVKKGETVQLACWCKPLKCHGDVVKSCIEWMIKEGIVWKKRKEKKEQITMRWKQTGGHDYDIH